MKTSSKNLWVLGQALLGNFGTVTGFKYIANYDKIWEHTITEDITAATIFDDMYYAIMVSSKLATCVREYSTNFDVMELKLAINSELILKKNRI